jgi:hypothetical protein
MPSCLSITVCLPVVRRFGRRAPRHESESQSSISLFHSPTRESIELTGNRLHSPICILNNDTLLHVFHLYQLHVQEEYSNTDGRHMIRWGRQRWWYKLVHVSRRWRYLILGSRSVLDLHLVCTYGVPVADMLAHSPPLPLTIFYYDNRKMTAEYEEGVLLALSHRDRVHHIALSMSAPDLCKFMPAMDGPFPILERLHINSETEETRLTLPVTFQAPNLRRLNLWDIPLPIASPLLTSTGGLVKLCLGGIPRSAYFPPGYLLTRLSLMPQLEWLTIGFHSPLPHRNVVSQLLDNPIMTHVTLPNLRVLKFQGVTAYLEGLLARISTPALSVLTVYFFNQLTFTIPRLLQSIQTSENLIFDAVDLIFGSDSIHLIADPHRKLSEQPLNLRIKCRHFDWQVASAMQILATLSPVISLVEKLFISHKEHYRSSEWHNQVDRIQWREFLAPFSNVKVLHLGDGFVGLGGLADSLPSRDGEMAMEILPNLQELSYSDSDIGGAFTALISERKAAGHPVAVNYRS